mmetsp:Transcript_3257/g.7239  ORF Transcript_3257/g.7239 Transcript_3257/m.7239 type:complete len:207 (+) Transcript_3257:2323-2943(+)
MCRSYTVTLEDGAGLGWWPTGFLRLQCRAARCSTLAWIAPFWVQAHRSPLGSIVTYPRKTSRFLRSPAAPFGRSSKASSSNRSRISQLRRLGRSCRGHLRGSWPRDLLSFSSNDQSSQTARAPAIEYDRHPKAPKPGSARRSHATRRSDFEGQSPGSARALLSRHEEAHACIPRSAEGGMVHPIGPTATPRVLGRSSSSVQFTKRK